jgi:hypothetical protein
MAKAKTVDKEVAANTAKPSKGWIAPVPQVGSRLLKEQGRRRLREFPP